MSAASEAKSIEIDVPSSKPTVSDDVAWVSRLQTCSEVVAWSRQTPLLWKATYVLVLLAGVVYGALIPIAWFRDREGRGAWPFFSVGFVWVMALINTFTTPEPAAIARLAKDTFSLSLHVSSTQSPGPLAAAMSSMRSSAVVTGGCLPGCTAFGIAAYLTLTGATGEYASWPWKVLAFALLFHGIVTASAGSATWQLICDLHVRQAHCLVAMLSSDSFADGEVEEEFRVVRAFLLETNEGFFKVNRVPVLLSYFSIGVFALTGYLRHDGLELGYLLFGLFCTLFAAKIMLHCAQVNSAFDGVVAAANERAARFVPAAVEYRVKARSPPPTAAQPSGLQDFVSRLTFRSEGGSAPVLRGSAAVVPGDSSAAVTVAAPATWAAPSKLSLDSAMPSMDRQLSLLRLCSLVLTCRPELAVLKIKFSYIVLARYLLAITTIAGVMIKFL